MHYRAIAADHLGSHLAQQLAERPGRLRVAIDGALGTDPHALAASIIAPLNALGRPAVHVRADSFWRDASLRLEYGHTDLDSLLHDWLDVSSLRREVLAPLGPDGDGQFLPSLRDPVTNRATRAARQAAAPDLVLLLSGEFLLGHELPFDVSVHLSASAAALERRTPAEWAWTLPAVARYEADVEPAARADIDIRITDPRHPAIRSAR